ncbi:TrbI/VirB10 family protein [Allosphingosinicella deserti]|uniref:Conjugal transfer protein TrbI n=1 Tax=Allosphingosinicella deserti TaxID=2116704 RepID=A0A2P7QEE3_9SPHN|nr:TrbI/VirB10 family protein [Sphingomonas deserti]PSJ36305.1 conjugal transfer protein TrbI [Sphingomonas deserti]
MTAPVEQPSEAEERPAPVKSDPESLALRAQPPRAIRFRRSVVIAIAALGSVGLAATGWMAFGSSSLRFSAPQDDREVAAKPAADAVSGLPRSYGDVPKLGPPLPGDLGRPILEHQRKMLSEPPAQQADPAREAAEMERERRAAELRAARESGLLAGSGIRSGQPGGGEATPVAVSEPPVGASRAPIDPGNDTNGQQRKADFIASRDDGDDVNVHRLTPPASPDMLSAGSVIAASLITGLRSDLPGLVTAQVTERVFDSATGTRLLIPQGARLVGRYDSVVAFGQRRALIVWQRIIMPDGSSVRLDNVPATDPSGYAGLADHVDFHTWTLLKGVAISTILGVGSNLTFSGESDLVRAVRESTQQNASRAGDQLAARNLQIQPTITIRPGAPVRMVVHRDLVLAPWKE